MCDEMFVVEFVDVIVCEGEDLCVFVFVDVCEEMEVLSVMYVCGCERARGEDDARGRGTSEMYVVYGVVCV